MKHSSSKKKGFTLIEVIISLCVIAIASVGLYMTYNNLIKTTKLGEEKQQISLIGRNTLENIRSRSNDDFTINENSIEIKGLDSLKFNKESSDDSDEFQDKSDRYTMITYFDKDYMSCSKDDAYYEQKISIKKAKAVSEDNKTTDVTPGVSEEKKDDDTGSYDFNFEDIDLDTLYISNEESDSAKIQDTYLYKENGKYLINVKIDKQGDNRVNVIITDKNDNKIKEYTKTIKVSKYNDLNLYFNFKNYKRSDDSEKLDNFDIEVYNKISSKDKIVCDLYIENSEECNVSVNAKKGQVNFSHKDSDDDRQFGTLYEIKVDIVKIEKVKDEKGEYINKKTKLFNGNATKNLVIKNDKN